MSTTARKAYLALLRRLGIRNFRSRSGLGYPFICHVGDFAGEVPFYNRDHSRAEITLMAAWCKDIDHPVIVDVGANVGFIATQLAQALSDAHPKIYAFEPVPSTFCKLLSSVQKLELEDRVSAICSAVSDSAGFCSMAYNPKESLFAQVRSDTENVRAGRQSTIASCVTLDTIVNGLGVKPTLLKIDVEGFEGHVLRGAKELLSGPEPPAICFEFNPTTLAEVGSSGKAIAEQLDGYRLFYIDDFEGQKLPLGEQVLNILSLGWAANLIAVSASSDVDVEKMFEIACAISNPLGHH